jgi:hypothetical protein
LSMSLILIMSWIKFYKKAEFRAGINFNFATSFLISKNNY